jgi:uncharacterized membrane protein YuzA (DUF378 family)
LSQKGDFMVKNGCIGCKLFAILVIVGALNWGVIAAIQVDYIAKFLPPLVARIVYGVVGLAGLAMLVGCFINCPCCKSEGKK